MEMETIILLGFVGAGLVGLIARVIIVRQRKLKKAAEREDLYPMF